jgi:hypothetical protein
MNPEGAQVSPMTAAPRRFVSPIGRPSKWRLITINPAVKPPRVVSLNRYPRQAIGIVFRLPPIDMGSGHRLDVALSWMWGRPVRWWVQ